MVYKYEDEKARLLVPLHIPDIIAVKTRIDSHLKITGAITYACVMRNMPSGFVDTFKMLACIDYLVECGYYRKVCGVSNAGQHQILCLPTGD